MMNLVCVCLDTFRADIIGPGQKLSFVDTPNLDAFERESVDFAQTFGEGQPTLQIRRALFTGRRSFPWRYNFDRRGHWHYAAGWHKIPPDQDTLSEILISHGYLTGLVADTYHMFRPTMNYTRGFASWDFIRGQEVDTWRFGSVDEVKDRMSRHVRDLENLEANAGMIQYLFNTRDRRREEDYFCGRVFRTAIDWIEHNTPNQPFFLWVDSFDPHEPWDPPAAYADRYAPDYDGKDFIWPHLAGPEMTQPERERVKALYFGEVTFVDKWVGAFFNRMTDLGLMDNTLVVVVSDHGTQVMDHGGFGKGPEALYAYNTGMVHLMRHPDGPREKKVDAFVQSHDVMPTMLSLLGIPHEVEGTDVWPLVTGETDSIRDHVVIGWAGWADGFAQGYVSVRDKRWNYIAAPHVDVNEDPSGHRLFDLAADPDEKHDVVSEHPQVVAKQRRRIETVLNQSLPAQMNELGAIRVYPPNIEYLHRRFEVFRRK